mmetsp:Transcript_7494/g.11417  ORF Transcript_7494/g.11417 Transcript_7494/m.11417 type:complete len:169 (+) Transcript_7494:96-602(+)|eukprot:CAMPEP_0178937556 /NCGR_PEP_ID=MMETSP0786-20121207/25829_1 /TAXON_ID=186022 /ORGANISM="Thalassionema frauenfeldii, Strain CCMP 1798" /LENGTH=168 /DNA_ID=CAMNT_0020616153 /DNA_START=55 /DNA_END=561 /DNA_ORIENTATION=+
MITRHLAAAFLFSVLNSFVQGFIAPQKPAFHPSVLFSDREGASGPAIAKPKIGQKTAVEVKTVQKVEIKRKIQPADPVSRKAEDFEEAPLFKVMLIGDDGYDANHVVERITSLMEELDDDAASTIFEQAQMAGQAMCGKYPLEHAEMYKEQLLRSDPMIFADIEDENA